MFQGGFAVFLQVYCVAGDGCIALPHFSRAIWGLPLYYLTFTSKKIIG